MKQMDSAAGGRRSSSVQRGSAGVFRATQTSGGGESGWLDDASMLQRTFGNGALSRAVASSSTASSSTASMKTHATRRDPHYATEVMQSIIARALAVPELAQDEPRPSAAGAPDIQRLISSAKFARKTTVGGAGKSNQLFADITQDLGILEGMPQTLVDSSSSQVDIARARGEFADRSRQMRKIFRQGNEWLIGPDSKGSSRKSHVEDLLDELSFELSLPLAMQGRDLANTARGKQGKGNLDKKGKKTPAQKQAITTINGTNLLPARKKHAIEMIRNPDTIQQGAFGVCGLTAILWAVAKSSPQRFAEMIRDAWLDQNLVNQWLDVFYNNADGEHIKQRAEVEYITSQWVVRKSAPQDVTNKVLSRNAQNQYDQTDKTKKYSDVLQNQRVFSDRFDIDAWENTKGHFALTGGAVSYLLNALGTAKDSFKVKHGSFAQDYNAARAAAGQGSILASVTDTDFYEEGAGQIRTAFQAAPNVPGKLAKPKFAHWVVLKEAQLDDPFWKIRLWTWRKNFTAEIHKNVINTYFHTLVAAQAE